jgi:hypothetical protein
MIDLRFQQCLPVSTTLRLPLPSVSFFLPPEKNDRKERLNISRYIRKMPRNGEMMGRRWVRFESGLQGLQTPSTVAG